MRYMVFVKMAEDVGEPPPALVEAMGKEMGEAFAAGWMLDAGGLYPPAQSTEIRVTAGDITVTDGPYAEAKEVVGGYSVIEVRSPEEAVAAARRVAELHREYWPGWEGSMEVRRIAGPDEGPASAG
ncbi:MAG TPA: YciI family protein [Nocardioidaceae bacterium]